VDTKKVKLIAFDLDGTLTQHKQPLTGKNLETMYQLAGKYKLVMAGAGQARRVFNQMGQFPIDIIANYGLQFAKYNDRTKDLDMVRNAVVECDRASIEARVTAAREKYGYTDFVGDNVEYHPSGCVTFPLLGTKADPADKLAFDPDRKKRRLIYEEIKSLFPEYNVFVGGSSSFDMAPIPYNKYYALDLYCREHGFSHDEVVYVGDDYGLGGNDESVYLSDIAFICVDDYRQFPELVAELL
jgi:HAD superfamily hydrolase (TIGR01484 family)